MRLCILYVRAVEGKPQYDLLHTVGLWKTNQKVDMQ